MADVTPPPGSGLGFRPKPDPRDDRYPIRLALEPLLARFPTDVPEGSKHYMILRRWIQGATGTCVEHGWRHFCEMSPIMQRLPYKQFDFYRKIIQRDEWIDNDHEATGPVEGLQSGTSVRAGGEQLRDDGLIQSYLWAHTVAEVRAWLLVVGPGVAGLPWLTGMMARDADGFVNATGQEEGGHCVAFKGWSDLIRSRGKIVKRNGVRVRGVRFVQSWNAYDYAWIAEDDLARLMTGYGEFCAPTEMRVKPLPVM